MKQPVRQDSGKGVANRRRAGRKSAELRRARGLETPGFNEGGRTRAEQEAQRKQDIDGFMASLRAYVPGKV